MRTLIGVVVLAIGLGAAPAAQADDSDKDGFLQFLHSLGIEGEYGDSSLVLNASKACMLLDEGYTPMQVGTKVWLDAGLSARTSGRFVGAAIY
jgi:uncharacterized protein DUF732